MSYSPSLDTFRKIFSTGVPRTDLAAMHRDVHGIDPKGPLVAVEGYTPMSLFESHGTANGMDALTPLTRGIFTTRHVENPRVRSSDGTAGAASGDILYRPWVNGPEDVHGDARYLADTAYVAVVGDQNWPILVQRLTDGSAALVATEAASYRPLRKADLVRVKRLLLHYHGEELHYTQGLRDLAANYALEDKHRTFAIPAHGDRPAFRLPLDVRMLIMAGETTQRKRSARGGLAAAAVTAGDDEAGAQEPVDEAAPPAKRARTKAVPVATAAAAAVPAGAVETTPLERLLAIASRMPTVLRIYGHTPAAGQRQHSPPETMKRAFASLSAFSPAVRGMAPTLTVESSHWFESPLVTPRAADLVEAYLSGAPTATDEIKRGTDKLTLAGAVRTLSDAVVVWAHPRLFVHVALRHAQQTHGSTFTTPEAIDVLTGILTDDHNRYGDVLRRVIDMTEAEINARSIIKGVGRLLGMTHPLNGKRRRDWTLADALEHGPFGLMIWLYANAAYWGVATNDKDNLGIVRPLAVQAGDDLVWLSVTTTFADVDAVVAKLTAQRSAPPPAPAPPAADKTAAEFDTLLVATGGSSTNPNELLHRVRAMAAGPDLPVLQTSW